MPNTQDNLGTGFDDGDALASVRTGVGEQSVMIAGLNSSKGDGGSPGPHVVIRGSEGELVFAAAQVSDLVDALLEVRDRIERMLQEEG